MTTSIDNLPVGAFYEDASGTLVSCNKKYLETLGGYSSASQKANWRQYLLDEDKPLAFSSWEKSFKIKKPIHINCRLNKSNGNVIWVDIKANPVLDNTGSLAGYSGILTDITNQVMFEKVLERFKKAVEKTESQIVFTDPGGLVLYANNGMEKTTGFSSGEIIGTKAGKLWGNLMDRGFYTRLWNQISKEKLPFSAELVNKKKNGETYFAEINITPVLDIKGEVEFYVGIERDITYIKEMDKVKNDFISLASHQLRTPLSSIKWLCELFWQEDTSKLSENQKETVAKVQGENERLIKLVNSLLNVSRIESKKINLNPSPTDISKLVQNIIDTFKKQLADRRQTIEISFPETDTELIIDEKLVGEAISNLLSNASKYTQPDGRLWVKGKISDSEYVISITDSGIGIPINDQRRIFEKFFRAKNANQTLTDGNGLGLYFVKWVAEQHGGRVWFESTENVGTTFYLTFPLKPKS